MGRSSGSPKYGTLSRDEIVWSTVGQLFYHDALPETYEVNMPGKDKNSRGNASQFFVAGELCRRGHLAVVTLGNAPNTDILCSNVEGTRFVHIQVKTYVPGNRTCSVGRKAETDFGVNFFWILGGIPAPESSAKFEYYVIPASEMAKHVAEGHQRWLDSPGRHGQDHRDNTMRVVNLPPYKSSHDSFDICSYLNRWDLIEERLRA